MNDIVKKDPMKFAEEIAKSNLVPKQFQGKPVDVYLAMSWGKELGISPIQALQDIAVINGKPSIYGDTMMALCRSHPEFEDIKETISGEGANRKAVCEIKRKNQSWYKTEFSMSDANRAGLLNRPGPWKSYPDRMLKMRARGFALRDVFADALGGVITREEAGDYPTRDPKPVETVMDKLDTVAKTALKAPTVASNEVNDVTPTKEKIVENTTPMAQETDMQPEVGKSQWEMRKLKGPGIYCEDHKSFAEEFSKAMGNIRIHKKSNKAEKLKFLKQLFQVNEDVIKDLETVDSGLHTSIFNEYISIAGELDENN